jgi:two-component system, chemotaxis family, sensor kinase CheA
MSSDSNEGFIQEFLEEAQEHLFSVREHLLALEQSLTQSKAGERSIPRHESVEHLFRSFHTIKGLSGMVGLQPAAHLSHSLESVLQAIQKTKIEVTGEVVQALFEGAEKLETVIISLASEGSVDIDVDAEVANLSKYHSDSTAPSTDQAAAPVSMPSTDNETSVSIDEFLENILGPYPDIRASLNENDHQSILNAILMGRYLWLCTFTPSPEWSEQGINVTQIRKNLSEIGTIVKAVPLVSGAVVRFAFLMATSSSVLIDQLPYLDWVVLLPGLEVQPVAAPGKLHTAAALPETHAKGLQSRLIRVDMNRLDELVQLVGELFIQRSVVAEKLNRLSGTDRVERRDLEQTMASMDRTLRRLRDAVLRTRMVPLAEAFNQMPLVVRDLARSTEKEVQLVIEGAETEIDKVLVERLFDPLLHLVRNAVSHGLESTTERIAAGKPDRGRLTLRGKPEGDHILIEVSDDGRGIDPEKIAARAHAQGLIASDQDLSNSDILEIISRPGFSTQEKADFDAGRGIGMDVVKRTVAGMNGAMMLSTQPGAGTTFTLRLPLSLVLLDAVLFRSENETFAIPKGLLDEVIQIDLKEIVQVESGELYPFRDDALVVYRLGRLFNLPAAEQSNASRSYRYGLVGNLGDRRTVLLVDQLIGLREIVVRPVSDPLISRPGVTGATEMGNGQVVLILDPNELLEEAKRKWIENENIHIV